MSAAEKKDILTPKFRVAFPEVFELNKDGKHSIMMLFDKDAQSTKGFKALVAKCKEVEGEKWNKRPKGFKSPFKQGERLQNDDDKFYGGCDEDTVALSAWTKFDIDVVKKANGDFKNLTSEGGEFYAGCYARAYVTPFAFDHKESSSKGVSLFLGNIVKVADGESLGGGISGAKAFADDDIESMEDSDFEGSSDSDDVDF